jgi:hypothetical protein
MRAIIVTCCGDCPYKDYDDGGGFIEPFYICDKYGMVLIDKNNSMNLDREIHRDCKLPGFIPHPTIGQGIVVREE